MTILNCEERSAVKHAAVKCGYAVSGNRISLVRICNTLFTEGNTDLAKRLRVMPEPDVEQIIRRIRGVVVRYAHFRFSGGGEIRTHGTLAGPPVFKTGAFDHSATPPVGASKCNGRGNFSQNAVVSVGANAAWVAALNPACSAGV